jgi:hypothetical protein
MISEVTFNFVRAHLQRLVHWPAMPRAKNIKKRDDAGNQEIFWSCIWISKHVVVD